MAHPTTRRLKASSTAARYSHPSPVGTYVMSASHKRSGANGVKSRWIRSGAGAAAGSLTVVRGRRRRRWHPASPAPRISRATRLRPCRRPAARSSAWRRGLP